MCGEHASVAVMVSPFFGSSPHVRGAPARRATSRRPSGIIPACAGSTIKKSSASPWSWDHPRMCGEHSASSWFSRPKPGSSPHVRGARDVSHDVGGGLGIIPACAGSTTLWLQWLVHLRDHPRMCGEHGVGSGSGSTSAGSSPHVRGAPCLARQLRPLGRIIPACAGSTP